jgi:hypothetical protein
MFPSANKKAKPTQVWLYPQWKMDRASPYFAGVDGNRCHEHLAPLWECRQSGKENYRTTRQSVNGKSRAKTKILPVCPAKRRIRTFADYPLSMKDNEAR